MIGQMTVEQLRIMTHATSFFRQLSTMSEMRPMFREDGNGVSVGLAYSEGSDNYIVRETISPYSSLCYIHETCNKLLSTLACTYSNHRAYERLVSGKSITDPSF